MRHILQAQKGILHLSPVRELLLIPNRWGPVMGKGGEFSLWGAIGQPLLKLN